MQAAAALRILQAWEPFAGLSLHWQQRLAGDLQALQLRPGQKLYDYSSLPPGVALINRGQLRLLSLDDQNEPFTLQRLAPGDMVGHVGLLRGVTGQAVAASDHCQVWLLPQASFLSAVTEEPTLMPWFVAMGMEELYAVAAASPLPWAPGRVALRAWASNHLIESASVGEVVLLPPGDHSFGADWGPWLLSSGNVSGFSPGDELLGPLRLNVKGLLPARLLAKAVATPPQDVPAALVVSPELGARPAPLAEVELLEPNWQESSTAIVSIRQHQEALQDWYGRLGDDGSVPQISGEGPVDAPLAVLRMLARFFDVPFRRDIVRRILEDQLQRGENGESISQLQLAAIVDVLGLRASVALLRAQEVNRLQFPVVLVRPEGPLIVWKLDASGQLLVGDPIHGQSWQPISRLAVEDPEDSVEVLRIERSARTPRKRFGLSWFLPALQEHKSVLAQVLVASFFVQLFGLLNPLLIQQIIDAVISQGTVSTLNVLGTLLVGLGLAQAVLGSLRTYLFSDATNRIDISLGSTIIDHLLRLPLGFFADRPVGEVSSRIHELEKIRRFLTGTALTAVLDAVFAFIYIIVMLLYSVTLTFWALVVVPFFLGITLVSAPIIRRQLRQQAEANARLQSHLVETLGGIETVKGQGMEIHSRWRWQQLYGGLIQSGFHNVVTSTAAGSATQFLEQLSGLLVLWVGAALVLKGEMTLGQLIAFRILASYVTNPLLRLANLWQNFQETSLSLERLADIVDQPEELEVAGSQRPPLRPVVGAVEYSGVSFRFAGQSGLQLSNVCFQVPAGSFVGVVGSSGSGKSTLLKLITRLYDPLEGVIRIDGSDIGKVDLYSLRAQIGVVPQESVLFDGSIYANIAQTVPDASFDEIRLAAEVACADAFIEDLPEGYNSSVGERGAALSGGQRQRIAIARMVLRRPRLLVLDEATSALDVDTERRLVANIKRVYQGMTVFFITHRLPSLKHADQIMVMDAGALVEQGDHHALMQMNGRYATLFRQQKTSN